MSWKAQLDNQVAGLNMGALIESDPKNAITKTLSSTDYRLQYDANDDLAAGGLLSGGAIYYGGIVVAVVEYNSGDQGSGLDVVRNNDLALVLADEITSGSAGKLQIYASDITNPVTSTVVFSDTRYVIAGAIGGSGTDKFAQVWVDGTQEDATSGTTVSPFPSSLPAWTPTNRQNVILYTFTPLLSAVESQDDLTALVEQAIAGF